MSKVLTSLSKPFIVSFEVTSQCQQKCIFCNARLEEYPCKDMSTEAALDVIAKLGKEEIRSIFITGGEPLLRKDLPLLIQECVKYQMNVTLSTNGLALDDELAEKLFEAGLDEIQVSIEAPAHLHDSIVGVDGAGERCLDSLRILSKSGIKVSAAAVAMKNNCAFLPMLAEKVAEAGAIHFRVLRLMTYSRELLSQMVPREQMLFLIDRLMELNEKIQGMTISVHASPGVYDDDFQIEKEYELLHPMCRTCTAGKISMGIMSNGQCVPCLELKGSNFECGNILEKSVSEIWNSEPMITLRQLTPDKYRDKCGNCKSKWSCYSARCVASNLQGDILGDDISCYKFIKSTVPSNF